MISAIQSGRINPTILLTPIISYQSMGIILYPTLGFSISPKILKVSDGLGNHLPGPAGPGRWLPKPSDTFRIFGEMLKPSVGYKMIPMLWYEMMGVNRIVGFILPDWIADIIPGKYPVHNQGGTVDPNFKSKVLDIVTGEFEAFKIPVPTGHIWDSFLRVFLGLSIGIILGVPLGLFMGP